MTNSQTEAILALRKKAWEIAAVYDEIWKGLAVGDMPRTTLLKHGGVHVGPASVRELECIVSWVERELQSADDESDVADLRQLRSDCNAVVRWIKEGL